MWKIRLGRNKRMREVEDKNMVVCEDNSGAGDLGEEDVWSDVEI